jgi:hypothetical protein
MAGSRRAKAAKDFNLRGLCGIGNHRRLCNQVDLQGTLVWWTLAGLLGGNAGHRSGERI